MDNWEEGRKLFQHKLFLILWVILILNNNNKKIIRKESSTSASVRAETTIP